MTAIQLFLLDGVLWVWSSDCMQYLFQLYIIIYFVKAANPACSELETVMLDWLGKMLQLPEDFLSETQGQGGGVIQVSHDTTASF